MGNVTSKAARKLPRRSEPPPWTGSASGARPVAREQKDQVIEEDARDPHFMSNLSRLGVVNVDHNMKSFRPHQKTREMIENRVRSEHEASSMQLLRNHVQVSTLTYLLDKSKSNVSREEITELADKHGIDVNILERLSEYVTSPSIKNDSTVRTVRKEDGEEEISVMAIWVESRALKTDNN